MLLSKKIACDIALKLIGIFSDGYMVLLKAY
jgi:hypothetical protein